MAIHLTAAMRVIATGMMSVIRYVFTLTTILIITKRAACWSLFIMALTGLSTAAFTVFAADIASSHFAANSNSNSNSGSSEAIKSDVSHTQAPISKTIVTTIQQTWQLNLLKEALRRSDSGYEVQQMATQMNQKTQGRRSTGWNSRCVLEYDLKRIRRNCATRAHSIV